MPFSFVDCVSGILIGGIIILSSFPFDSSLSILSSLFVNFSFSTFSVSFSFSIVTLPTSVF
jgi:hypothetical protein